MSRSSDLALPAATAEGPPRDLGRRLRRQARLAVALRLAQAGAAVRRGPQALGEGGLEGFRKLARADPARALGLVRAAQRVWPRGGLLAAAEAVLVARTRGWDAAAPLLARVAAAPPKGAAGLLRRAPAPGLLMALPAARTAAALPPAAAAATVVYTAAFGAAAPRAGLLRAAAGAAPALPDRPRPRGARLGDGGGGAAGHRPGARRGLVPHPAAPGARRGRPRGDRLALARPRPLAGRQPRDAASPAGACRTRWSCGATATAATGRTSPRRRC